ncbi:hypothetical protein FRC19_007399 [Serendipita sp. 401]|nr:hypothetical protein FRC16_006648 [Serendipita sp. 398]KAG8821701.1 hypothetical protein FRC19_007399 [Serendipita sp. 401]KAG9053073.1 hypothetical protein FS842_008735 [Serendipita sp. 407]
MHQAILRNKTLQTLVVSAKTHCSVPCKDALQKNVGVGSIRKLQIIELGNELGELGIVGAGLYSTGPRRCVFLSHMILTHSASLRVLTVAITLLYDALKPFSPHNLPDFPNLSSLQIDDSKSSLALEALLPTMSTIVVKFILHVHQTLDILRWGLNVTESMTKEITADHLPNLTKLSGYKIQHLTRLHRVKVLGIMGLCPSDFDSEKDWSLLRETSTRLPDLSTLAVSTIVQLTAILHDIRIFTNIVDLWYEELSGCIPYHYESQTREDFIFEFVHIVLPALPKLRQFCITADGSVLDSGANIRSTEEVLSSSRSLLRLTIQYVLQARACYRFDACRNDVQSEWTYEPFEGFEYLRKFSL